jgi:hypothetical protein
LGGVRHKVCPVCGRNKKIQEFSKDKSKSDGLQYRCKECAKIVKIFYREQNPNYYKGYSSIIQHQQYIENNPDYYKKYQRVRRGNDIRFKLACSLRRRLWNALRRGFKSGSAIRDLGCSIDELKLHLEKQFHPGMTWDNYGKIWTIDHKIPLAYFDLTNRQELKLAVHFSNIQPLWAKENIKKGSLYDNRKYSYQNKGGK